MPGMSIKVGTERYTVELDDETQFEAELLKGGWPITPAMQTAIDTKYGTIQQRIDSQTERVATPIGPVAQACKDALDIVVAAGGAVTAVQLRTLNITTARLVLQLFLRLRERD